MAQRYGSQELTKAYKINKREKKKQYNEQIREVEHESLTPLVMTVLVGMRRESVMILVYQSQFPKDVKSDTV